MTIHLYAEHLVNIRTLSITATLATPTTDDTKAELRANGTVLALTHEGQSASIVLPIPAPNGRDQASLDIPSVPTKHLSFRVQLEDGTDCLRGNTDPDVGEVIPWTAISLDAETEISCKSCSATLLARGRIRVWKDLPSENWAEMMDFWHCHRPDVPHDHDHKTPLKGYSADSRLAIQSGVGMVDPIDFVFAPDDCTNLTTVSTAETTSEDGLLQCTQCKTIVGQIHSSSEGYKLRKMHISLSGAAERLSTSYDAEKWLSCHLLSSIDGQGVRKFRIQSTDHNDVPLKVWIFTPDITVASSQARDAKPVRAIKVFWVDVDPSQPGDEGKLNQQTLSEGEIELPTGELKVLRQTLIRSAMLLPEASRKFQDWNVALLARFTNADVEDLPSQLPIRSERNANGDGRPVPRQDSKPQNHELKSQ